MDCPTKENTKLNVQSIKLISRYIKSWAAGCVHLHEVDDGEPVLLVGARVGHGEVEPLGVLGGVEVIAQPKLILKLRPATQHHQVRQGYK